MCKRILILGASKNQLPLILKSKSLGYYVIDCDNTTTNPGLEFVDKHYQVNFMDRKMVLRVALEEKIDGVISNSEPAMPVVAFISQQLNLQGNTEDSISHFMDKDSFRRLQTKLGLFSPKHFIVSSKEEFYEEIGNISFPIIIKPCQSSGSRGTTKIRSLNESSLIRTAIAECLEFSRDKKVAIEEYVEMEKPQIIEGEIFVYNGKIIWDGLFYNRRSFKYPLVPKTDCGPIMGESCIEKVKMVLKNIISNSGFTFGQINPELYFTKENDVFVIEINPRQGGGHNSEFIKQFSGIDLHRLLVTLCVGDESYYEELINYKREFHNIISHQIFSDRRGKYNGLFISDEIRDKVIQVEEKKQRGEVVSACSNATDVLAQVFLEFEDPKEMSNYFENIDNFIYPLVL